MNNACTSRWCRRSRIITKRQWRRFEKHPMRLFWWLTGIITGIFILCIMFAGRSETAYTAFGSYFTALAFVGVIVTVLLQRAELQEQRKELRAQRIELEGQKRELEIQNCTAQLQRFENGFFHLLDNFKTILEESRNSHLMMSFKPSQGLLTPYTIIEKEYDINEDIQTFIATLFINLPISLKKLVRTYYAIIDFIYTHDAFKNKKYDYSKYISILNIYLENIEYAILFYTSILDNKKIKLANELHLFSHYALLEDRYIPVRPEHVLFFSPQAFGEDYEEYIRRHGLQGKTLEDFLQ